MRKYGLVREFSRFISLLLRATRATRRQLGCMQAN